MATTTNFGWETPDDTDLVKDGAAAMRTLGSAIDTSFIDLKGGTTGQILSKASNTDLDYTWITNDQGDITGITASSPLTGGGTSGAVTVGIQDATTSVKGAVQLSDSTSTTSSVLAATPTAVKSAYDLANGAIAKSTLTTAGDIIFRNATVPTRLAIGTANQYLAVNSGATAPEWKNLPAGGMTVITAGGNFSGASTFDVDNVFTSTYDHYKLICVTTAGSGSAAEIRINFRTSGVTNTNASYQYAGQARLYGSATSDFSNASGATNAFVWRTNGSIWSGELEIYNPFVAERTWFHGTKMDTYEAGTVGGYFDNTTSFDGFRITNTSGTNITGKIWVYGYNK